MIRKAAHLWVYPPGNLVGPAKLLRDYRRPDVRSVPPPAMELSYRRAIMESHKADQS